MNVSVTISLPDLLPGLRRTPPVPPPVPQPPVKLHESCHGAMADLLQRLDIALEWRSGRIIQFLSARPGEGTTSIATAYAAAATGIMKRRVLLVDASTAGGGNGHEGDAQPGLVDAALSGRPLVDAVRPLSPLLGAARLVSDAGVAANMLSLIVRVDFWDQLRADFAEVVIDSPSAARSRTSLVTAAHADGVAVVVEAERSRAPVVRKLIGDLEAVGANVVGTVLNKRRFHVPAAVYERL